MLDIINSWKDRVFYLKCKRITTLDLSSYCGLRSPHISRLVRRQIKNPTVETVDALEKAIRHFEDVVRECEGQ